LVFRRIFMSAKPDYDELEKRIVLLEKEVAERTKKGQTLSEEAQRWRILVDQSKDGIAILDENGKVYEVNKVHAEMLGYSIEEMRELYVWDWDQKYSKEHLLEKIDETGEKGDHFETRHRRKDGTYCEVEVSTNGAVIGGEKFVFCVNRDITDRKQSEKALKESEERYRALFENMPIACFTFDADNRILDWNVEAENVYGYTKTEAVGANGYDLIVTPETKENTKEVIRRVFAGEIIKGSEWRDKNKEGETGWRIGNTFPLMRTDRSIDVGVNMNIDITERKRTEEALRESEEKFRILFELAPDGYVLLHSDKTFLDGNRAVEGIIGYKREEYIGKSYIDLNLLPPEYHSKASEFLERTAEGKGSGPKEFFINKKDGHQVIVEARAFPTKISGQGVILLIGRDVTDRKLLESQLLHAQKMESIGTMAGGIAHDFNNLLMGIQGNTSLMIADIFSSNPHYEMLKRIEEYVKNGAALTRQLLGFARGGKYEVKTVDLNKIIKGSAELFSRTGKEITLHTRFEKALRPCDVDQSQIEQVLLNLFVNAWHAMPGGGDLFISTENADLDPHYVKVYKVEPGKYVKISVQDTGVGMDEATRQKIFDPFFTTKEMGRGTGLGLASVYGIVKNHGGIIEVSSVEGESTTFFIYLPASEKKILEETDTEEKIIKGSGTLLLVDDEDMIITTSEEMLQRLGYTVLTAKSGSEALDIYEKKKSEIDLVILDLIMPGMSGSETYEGLKKLNPNIKVLLASGYSMDGQASDLLKKGCSGFIQKPFPLERLSTKINDILGKG
jgi:PAS domain S-box-containing protein